MKGFMSLLLMISAEAYAQSVPIFTVDQSQHIKSEQFLSHDEMKKNNQVWPFGNYHSS